MPRCYDARIKRRSEGDRQSLSAPGLVEHYFRHEYGRLVAMLSCRVGVENLQDIEDAVQTALISALENWTIAGVPENRSAWLYRVAHNQLVGELRQRTRRDGLLRRDASEESECYVAPEVFLPDEISDELLRMLFVCCDGAVPLESQIILALKVLCGFDVREIAIRLFASEANVYKRLDRARDTLRRLGPQLNELTKRQTAARLSAVHKVLYLLFTEGYLSSHAEEAIRREMCQEAIRLTTLLANHPAASVETFALLALMHLHSARIKSREDPAGGLLLLEEQDRTHWDRDQIHEGLTWLAKSARGDCFSRYHAEAGIAAEHCLSPSFHETRWDKVAEYYLILEQNVASPIHILNRAIAVAEWKGAAEGLAILEGIKPPPWLAESYLWAAVQADFHGRCGNDESMKAYREIAIKSAPSSHVKKMLERRLVFRSIARDK